jgi:hypothetical protein
MSYTEREWMARAFGPSEAEKKGNFPRKREKEW